MYYAKNVEQGIFTNDNFGDQEDYEGGDDQGGEDHYAADGAEDGSNYYEGESQGGEIFS